MPEDLQIRILKHRAHSLSRALFLHLDGYVEDYPSEIPLALASTLKIATAAIELKIEAAGERRLKMICRTLIDLTADVMTLLDHTHTAQTPRGLSQLLDQLHRALYPGTTLLVSPSNYHNYTITNIYPELRQLLNNVLGDTQWNRIFGRYRQGITVVTFPRMERENILLHAVFGHELAHPIADEFIDNEDPKRPEYESELQAMYDGLAHAYRVEWGELGKEARDREVRKVNDRTLKIKNRGLQELLSDVVSVQIFGPSALFAAAEILLEKSLDLLPSGEDLYPASRRRLRIMLAELERTGQLDALRSLEVVGENEIIRDTALQYIAYIKGLTDARMDGELISAAKEISIAYGWVDSTLERGIEFASNRVSSVKFDAATIASQLAAALNRVQAGVPPSEFGTPPDTTALDWRTAILAGWCCKLYLCKDSPMPDEAPQEPLAQDKRRRRPFSWKVRHDKIVSVHELSLKGIEDSILKAQYDLSPFGREG